MDKIKVAVAVLLVVAGIAGFYYLQDSATVIRLAAVLGGLAAGAAVLWTSAPGQSLFAFAQESAAETRKVVWPTRNETLQASSSIGRASVSKTEGWGFDSLLACQNRRYLIHPAIRSAGVSGCQ